MTTEKNILGLVYDCLNWKPKDRLILVWFILSTLLSYVACELLQGKTTLTPTDINTWFYPFLVMLFCICYTGSIFHSQIYRNDIRCQVHHLSSFFFTGIIVTVLIAGYVIINFIYFAPLQWQEVVLGVLFFPWLAMFFISWFKSFNIATETEVIKKVYRNPKRGRR